MIGHIIFHSYDEESYEIGWILDDQYWGKGYAEELTEAFIQFAKKEGINSLIIECVPDQTATIHIAVKYGFKMMNRDELVTYILKI